MASKASLRRLKLSNYKLNTLLDITQAINDNESTEKLLDRYENILRNELNIGKVAVYSFNKSWRRILVSGLGEQFSDELDVKKDLLNYTDISNLATTSKSNNRLDTFDVIIPVFHKDIPLAYVLIGDIDEERSGISPTIKHLHFIQTLTNVIIVAIENKRLFNENIRQEAIRKELELASKMQTMLIPDNNALPTNDYLHATAFYHPHSEVGGDYYDIVQLSEHEYGFCIADVSGKGISAALLMSNFQASLRALFTSNISLRQLVKKLNEIVMTNTKGEKFITLFIGKYNSKKQFIKYINAGHNQPIFIRDNKIRYLKNGCIGLGMFREIPVIKEGRISITPGSKLLCYTDGLVEVENESNIEFGTAKVVNAIRKADSIDTAIENIISKLNIHKGNLNYFDDVTIIGLEFY